MIKFPEKFLWGAATSSYQVEGNNANSDWWHWELARGKENSGLACRHYELYKPDFDLVKSLNHNAHRISIEWSRIEPEQGKFSQEELKHYLNVILALRARSIEPMVTLHHFTNPVWFSKIGGWGNKEASSCFSRYCDFVVRALGKHVRYWLTINEPTVYISHAYILGVWPPQEKSYTKALAVAGNFIAAHIQAYSLIHKIYKELRFSSPFVSIAHNVQAFVPCRRSLKDRFAVYLRDKVCNFKFLDAIMRPRSLDFIGINYYSRQLVEVRSWKISDLALDVCENNHHPLRKNSLGWDIYPEGLYTLLLKLKSYGLPLVITENGICTAYDQERWDYICSHLRSIHLAMEKGVNVAGYFYWSLMDNFEWDKGFGPRFGLIEIDYNSFKRTVRSSAVKFAQVCKTGVLE